jgi:hypothetical protein
VDRFRTGEETAAKLAFEAVGTLQRFDVQRSFVASILTERRVVGNSKGEFAVSVTSDVERIASVGVSHPQFWLLSNLNSHATRLWSAQLGLGATQGDVMRKPQSHQTNTICG